MRSRVAPPHRQRSRRMARVRMFNMDQRPRLTSEFLTADGSTRDPLRCGNAHPSKGSPRHGKEIKEVEHFLDGAPPQTPCRRSSACGVGAAGGWFWLVWFVATGVQFCGLILAGWSYGRLALKLRLR